ncbi:hypothetical protein CVIRNUC_000137 [Coccomyxa viridis]|uniref:Uncharacterized protein n=1 Tax=Coccomyxa viridis TaxID=1274662 RepID=A0AAV1HTA1_9CHLO|nr:hypothetical protein CVIRNUC_000137 [Coccomyxa viridis]
MIKWLPGIVFALAVASKTVVQAPTPARSLNGAPRWTPRPLPSPAADGPKQIPRIIHRIDLQSHVIFSPNEANWRRLNPGWELMIWNEEACLQFVQKEYPSYLGAYRALGRTVGQSDFFRYMVVLRMGGVYMDGDVECRRPLDELILPGDTLVAGWEAEFPNASIARAKEYVRKRQVQALNIGNFLVKLYILLDGSPAEQLLLDDTLEASRGGTPPRVMQRHSKGVAYTYQVLQWAFAAAPGHPALRQVCEHIARHEGELISADARRDVLERTGPGPWTDAVLRHARLRPLSKDGTRWRARVLPIVTLGVHPHRQDDWTPGFPEAAVMHQFTGSWRYTVRLKIPGVPLATDAPTKQRSLYRPEYLEDEHGFKVRPEQELPFDRSDKQLYPVSVTWQPPFTMMVDLIGAGDLQSGSDVGAELTKWGAWQPSLRHDRAPTALGALIGGLESTGTASRVLVDVGAGIGYLSLAAAARGHSVIAFELATRTLVSFAASMQHNNLSHAITLHQVALGSVDEETCIVPDAARMDPETARGYGLPKDHQRGTGNQTNGCWRKEQRRAGAGLVPQGADVGAVRVSVGGWEGWVLEGLQELWTAQNRTPPAVILMDLYPEKLRRNGYAGGAAAILDRLYSDGYEHILHAGPRCDARQNATQPRQSEGPLADLRQEPFGQFTWCTLQPEQFSALENTLQPSRQPENVLFTYKLSHQRTHARNSGEGLIGPRPAQLIGGSGAAVTRH